MSAWDIAVDLAQASDGAIDVPREDADGAVVLVAGDRMATLSGDTWTLYRNDAWEGSHVRRWVEHSAGSGDARGVLSAWLTPLSAVARATSARTTARQAYEAADAHWRETIKAAREAHTARLVAEAAGITRGRVTQIEQGRR